MHKINAYSPWVGRVQGREKHYGNTSIIKVSIWVTRFDILFGVTFRFNFYFIYFHNLLPCIERHKQIKRI